MKNTCGIIHLSFWPYMTLPPSLQEGPSKESPSHPWVWHRGRSDSTPCNCGRLRGCGVSFPSWDGSWRFQLAKLTDPTDLQEIQWIDSKLINCKAFPCFSSRSKVTIWLQKNRTTPGLWCRSSWVPRRMRSRLWCRSCWRTRNKRSFEDVVLSIDLHIKL